MKVLLDENLPHVLRHKLVGHTVYTVAFCGWCGTTNGALLKKAGDDGFDAMITLDNGVAYQQNPTTLPVAVLIVRAVSNDIDDLTPLVPAILASLQQLPGRTIIRIG